ncbi:MAG TPA: hypothetical protein VGQ39_05045 [Pyrinomonadaceae bacterium]|nr:hypothetical protein [Pyrinomonadaceae bacterium]
MNTSLCFPWKIAVATSKAFTLFTNSPAALKLAIAATALFSVAANALAQTCAGCLDPTFGGGGVVVTATTGPAIGSTEVDSVLQSNGQLVLLMTAANPGTTIRNSIGRLTADGNVDTTFGVGGFRDIVWSAPNGGIASTIAIQIVQTGSGPGERFVIAGGFPCGRNSSCLHIERYTNAGSLDTSFGSNGVSTLDFSPSLCGSATQSDQKVLFACGDNVARINSNGSADSSFGKNGISQAKTGLFIRTVTVLSNDRILGVGELPKGTNRDFAVARFNANGFRCVALFAERLARFSRSNKEES